jgi:hypothetical protein
MDEESNKIEQLQLRNDATIKYHFEKILFAPKTRCFAPACRQTGQRFPILSLKHSALSEKIIHLKKILYYCIVPYQVKTK